MMDAEQEQFCFSLLEDDLHSTFTKVPFVEGMQFTNLFQELDLYCESDAATGREGGKPLVVVGDTGVGKSAAIANWAARRVGNAPSTRNRLDFAEFVFYHAMGCSRLSTQVVQLLRRLVNSIISHFQIKDVMNLSDEKLPWILPRLLEKASKKGRLIICVDGLHHICSNDKDYGLKWLPTCLPAGVKMIVSATTPNVTPADQGQHPSEYAKRFQIKVQQTWNEIHRRKWPTLPLECMQSTCVANYIEKYLSFETQCSPQQILDMRSQVIEVICNHPLATNPMFVKFLLRGLCHAIGLGYNWNQCLVAWMPCHTIAELVEYMLLLFEAGSSGMGSVGGRNMSRLGPLLGDSLPLLFVARHGLHERELMELLDLMHQQSNWNDLTEGTAVPITLKILQMLMENKQRLIDIFRSFDTDGNGTLSRDELFAGMERLDIDVNHDEISLLVDDSDVNGDGEIDYQELMTTFEHKARSYSHGKRRGSVFGHEQPSSNHAFSLPNEQKQQLITTLRCVGVTCLDRGGSILTLPFDNPALRAAIWKKYIKCENTESKFRTLLIESLSKKEPSLRYCEELPWHLKKEKKWNEMKKVLVDLRTLDNMFYSVELKAELFSYLRILGVGEGGKAVTFDIIADYNRSVQLWNQRTNPSSKHTSLMCSFIADVMAWFDLGISEITQSPPFLRERVGDEWLLKLGIDFSTSSRLGTAVSKNATAGLRTPDRLRSEAHYFFNRWIWIQFPWLSLASSSEPEAIVVVQPTANASDDISVAQPENMIINLRDKAMIHAKEIKLKKIESIKPKKTSPKSIPLSSDNLTEIEAGVSTSNSRHEGTAAAKKLRELKSIHDRLQLEVEARERHSKELERALQVRRIGNMKSQKSIIRGEGVLTALQSRLDQMNGLIDQASHVDIIFNNIILALHSCEPTQAHQLKLESQIVLSRQQIADLQSERETILKETDITDSKSKKLEEEVKSMAAERQRIKPLLDSNRKLANEEDIRKNARVGVAAFDAEAFSRRARIEGKLAKRREEVQKRNASFALVDVTKLSKLHPMERIAQIAGTRDPNVMAAMLNESGAELRLRQEQEEQHVKEQEATLISLRGEINRIHFSDGFVKATASEHHDSDYLLCSKQKRLDSMSQFVHTLCLAVLHVSNKVQLIELTGGIQFSRFLMANEEHRQVHTDAKRLIESMKTLNKEIPSDFIMLTEKGHDDENDHPNVRILNRAEKESQFALVGDDLHELENEDGKNADEGNGILDLYVSEGISTNESRNQQRKSAVLSHAKLANKGIILETVLQAAAESKIPHSGHSS